MLQNVLALQNGILFFDSGSEERASSNQKQNTVASQRGAEASSRSKRNKWGVARREDPVYAGFELELAGAKRYRLEEQRSFN